MKKSKMSLIFKKAPFPATMTIISFVLFIAVYLFVTMTSIEPYYFEGLIFGVPFVFFGTITFFTVRQKLKVTASSVITFILIFIFGVGMLFLFISISIDAAITVTTDVSKYERVLKLTNYPNNTLIKNFPAKIPASTKNIVFSYNPALFQGGENFGLKFEAHSDSIKNYIEEFSKKAKWTGKASDTEAEKRGVYSGLFKSFGYTELPEDFIIYLIESKPYHPDDWNHGEISLAAISKQRNEIIFIAEDW